jgi:hypothetical protein
MDLAEVDDIESSAGLTLREFEQGDGSRSKLIVVADEDDV